MRRFTVTTIAAQLLFCGSATPLWAQPTGGSTASAPRVELAAGYQAQRLGVTEGRGLFKGGWVEVAGTGRKALVLQVGVSCDSHHYSHGFGEYAYSGRSTSTYARAMAGTRWARQSGSVRP